MNSLEIKQELQCLKCFRGVFSLDQLPSLNKYPAGIIVNTDPSNKPGEHWVAIYIDKKGVGFYFDSFGMKPLQKSIVLFMQANCPNGWDYNNVTFQSANALSCGAYCVTFIKVMCSGKTAKYFIHMFSRKTNLNDVMAWYINL
jgi:hypothetical protein